MLYSINISNTAAHTRSRYFSSLHNSYGKIIFAHYEDNIHRTSEKAISLMSGGFLLIKTESFQLCFC